tara:strand:- start:271 stop:552 length:282 start_codon:yes stop_codon:yes gene_type:complete
MAKAEIEEEIEERTFAIYPNPANNWVSIVLPESEDKFEIVIRDLAGKIIFQQPAQRNLVSWDISSISNGIYMVSVYTISTQEVLGTQKIIVQH